MKKLIIAEKASVGRDLAIFFNCLDDKKTHFENDNFIITWARGHLVKLANPDKYGYDYSLSTLPMLPNIYIKEAIRSSESQLKAVGDLMNKCSEIIVATDAGREGELIFRYIYQHIHCCKPFKRLWLQSLTHEGIEEAYKKIKGGNEYDNLYHSGNSRAMADWLVGMNVTRALTLINSQSNKTISAGRVKSPTLSIISERFIQNKIFKVVPFFYPQIQITSDNGFKTILKSNQQFSSKEESEQASKNLKEIRGVEYQKAQTFERTPLLFSLNDLQIQANKKFDYSPTKTLDLAQKLYEKQYITYPRSDSRHLTADMTTQVFNIISRMNSCSVELIAESSNIITYKTADSLEEHKVFDNSQVSDHYGIIPLYKFDNLESEEKNIFYLIVERFLKAFGDDAIYSTIKSVFKSEMLDFNYHSKTLLKSGFKNVRLTDVVIDEEDEKTEINIHEFTKDKSYIVQGVTTLRGETSPQKLHTIASLLALMENPKGLLESELYNPKNKGFSLGTPSTRAGIIQTLIETDETVIVKGKNLIPTEKGLAVYNAIKDYSFSKTDLTAEWEYKLQKIANGNFSHEVFDDEIRQMIKLLIDKMKDSKISIAEKNAQICPKCKQGVLIDKGFFYSCSNRVESVCDFSFNKEKGGTKIGMDTLKQLIEEGKSVKKQTFTSKEGKAFDAFLAFDADYKLIYQFSESVGQCPKCKGELSIANKWINCSTKDCYQIYTEQFGKILSNKEILELIRKGNVIIKDFYSVKTQKFFDSTLVLFEEEGKWKTRLDFTKI